MDVANTVAHYNTATIVAVKRLTVRAPGSKLQVKKVLLHRPEFPSH